MYFTKHTLLLSSHTNTNKERNETIVIVTDKIWSAVNCPIKVEIVPFSWLPLRVLLISQSTHCCHQHTNTNRDSANEKIEIVTHKDCSAVNSPIKVGIVPLSWLL